MKYDENEDISISFLLPQFALRGRLVRLQKINNEILRQHDYPDTIAKYVTEFLAGSAALASLLKYEGVFTLQTKTSGPLKLVVIDITHEGNIRGYAQFKNGELLKDDQFKQIVGNGYLAFTVDQGLTVARYQGIVTLDHDNLSQALEYYFAQSEQLETKFFIAADKTNQGSWKSAALLLQQMPSEKVETETWNYIESVFATLLNREFLNFSIDYKTLLYRLFHEGGVTVFEPKVLRAKCRCSSERIKAFLDTIDPDQVESLLEKGHLKMTCEFCNHLYEFDRKDLMTVH